MRIYISGPITGQEDTARERFGEACEEVYQRYPPKDGESLSIIDPFWSNNKIFVHFGEIPSHDDYMVTSMAMLSICDTIYLLHGWQNSKDCQQEYEYAKRHGYKIYFQQGATSNGKTGA